jgi:predicted RNA-binding Zn ribbon-like protein
MSRFEYIAGSPALDFVNTRSWPDVLDTELLVEYADLVRWAEEGGAIPAADARLLKRHAAQEPERAARELAAAVRLRSVLHEVFDAIARGEEPDLGAFNRAAQPALRDLAIVPVAGAYRLQPERDRHDLGRIAALVAWDAAQLLASDRVHKIGCCANDTCGWLFVDESRRHNRRWCSMEDCGSRAKAREYYRRKREAEG